MRVIEEEQSPRGRCEDTKREDSRLFRVWEAMRPRGKLPALPDWSRHGSSKLGTVGQAEPGWLPQHPSQGQGRASIDDRR